MLVTIRYTLLTAVRDLLYVGLLLAALLAIALSIFIGGTALAEQRQMSVVYIAASTRIVFVVGMILFVCFHVRRMFDNREINMILSMPISRTSFVLSYCLGFVFVAILAILPIFLFLSLFFSINLAGTLFWALSVLMEVMLVIAFALSSAFILGSAATSALACFGFYFLSRIIGFFIASIAMPDSLYSDSRFGIFITTLLKGISALLPRLDFYGKSSWLVYGVDGAQDNLSVHRCWTHNFIIMGTFPRRSQSIPRSCQNAKTATRQGKGGEKIIERAKSAFDLKCIANFFFQLHES